MTVPSWIRAPILPCEDDPDELRAIIADLRGYLHESIKAYEAQNHRITQLEALYDKSLKQRAALLKRLEDQAWHTRWNRGR